MNHVDSSLRVTPSPVNPWLALAGWITLCAVTGAVGAIASIDAKEFYATLEQPAWAPPSAVFGPVWTLLYISMAVSAWLVWRERGFARARGALGLFVAQLVLNALWSWLFFAWHQGALAFIDVLLLLVLIAATIVSFWRLSRVAAVLLVPYVLWVGFASVLTWAVWRGNPGVL